MLSKTRLFSAVIVVLSLLLVLGSGEIFVRLVFPYNTPETVRRYSIPYAPSIFSKHRLKPVARIVEEDGSKGLGTKKAHERPLHRFYINETGFRGRSFSVRKPQGIIRIVIVGGSSVFDANARDASDEEGKDWPHLVEGMLKRSGYSQVEVINAGVPGHATFDSLGRLYSQIWMYQPDYVLLYNCWNDIKYFRVVTPEQPLITLFSPFREGANPFVHYQGYFDELLCNFQLYVKFRNHYYSKKYQVGGEGLIPQDNYRDSYTPYGLQQYRLNVQLIVDACRNIGATPVLVPEATLVTANNTPEERKLIGYERQRLTHDALLRAIQDTYQVLREVARQKGVEVLDLTTKLNGRREFFIDAVHLSDRGSQEIAGLVASFVASRLKN